jgi:DNA sulfur modification protein DndD
LIIHKLELNNFGPYYGKHIIEFKPGVNVIYGNNGSGKTCIFRAIKFGLFGNRLTDSNQSFINRNHLASGGKYGELKLTFSLLGKQYKIERSIKRNGDIETKVNAQKNQTLEDIYQKLPPHTSTFFLFDGEEIRQWMMSLADDKWDTASVMGFNIYRGIFSDLENARKKINDSLSMIEQDSGITVIREKLNTLNVEIKQNKRSITKLRTEMRELDQHLRILNEIKNHASDLETDMKRLEFLKKEIRNTNKDLEKINKKARINAQLMPYYMIKEELIEAIRLVEHMKELAFNARLEQGRLDSQLEIIQEIERAEKCLCGNELAASTFGKRSISKLAREIEDDIQKFNKAANAEFWPNISLIEMRAKVEIATKARQLLLDELNIIKNLEHQLNELRSEQELLNSKIKEIRIRVQPLLKQEKIPLKAWPNSSQLSKHISSLDGKRNELKGSIDTYNSLIQKRKEEIDDNKSELNQLLAQKRNQIKKLETAGQTLDNISGIIENSVTIAIKQVILELKEKFQDIFRTITNKPNEFIGVDFSSLEGRPMIITKNGSALSMTDISDGEKQILMFSLMSALKHLSPSEVLVVDAPFGRLDSIHIDSIIKFLPDMAKQTIIMITDREFEEIKKRNVGLESWKINNEGGQSKFELFR